MKEIKKTVILDSLNEVINKSNYSETEKAELLQYFEKVYDR